MLKLMQVADVQNCSDWLYLQFNLSLGKFYSQDAFASIAAYVQATGGGFAIRNMPRGSQGEGATIPGNTASLHYNMPATAALPRTEFTSLAHLTELVTAMQRSQVKFHVFHASNRDECGIDGVIWHQETLYWTKVLCLQG
jgi:hypothetical protein